jgi:single-strand DNA-binding protein
MNSVLLRGTLSSTPQLRTLASGSLLYSLEVTTTTGTGTDQRSCSVPVAWFDPASTPEFDTGDEVVVVGSVRRRFFRGASGTQSRTEVVATDVVSAGSRRKVQRLLQRELDRLGTAVGGALRSV